MSKAEVTVFISSLISEGTSHHSYHVLLIRSKSLGPAHTPGERTKDHKHQEAGIIRGCLRSCAPLHHFCIQLCRSIIFVFYKQLNIAAQLSMFHRFLESKCGRRRHPISCPCPSGPSLLPPLTSCRHRSNQAWYSNT